MAQLEQTLIRRSQNWMLCFNEINIDVVKKVLDFLWHINYHLIVAQKVGDEDVATHRQT